MHFSVYFCTYNRCDLLPGILDSFAQVRIPDGLTWELLIVNNNSHDSTGKFLADYVRLHEGKPGAPPLRIVEEMRPGVAPARNKAVQEARGEWILSTDDDCLVDPLWLSAYADAVASHPHAVFFGGTILPRFESTPPAYVEFYPKLLEQLFSVTQYDEDVRPLRVEENLLTCNFCCRADILKAFRFDNRLGRIGSPLAGGNQTGGEELDLVRRLLQHGHQGIWVGPAVVRHLIPDARLTLPALWHGYRGNGRTWIRTDGIPAGACWRGRPRWILRNYLTARFAAFHNRARGNPAWLRHWLNSAYWKGALEEIPVVRQEQTQERLNSHPNNTPAESRGA